MTRRPAVPEAATFLVGLSVSRSDRATLLGDLEERFARRVAVRGERAARRWYRGQAVRIVFALGTRRVVGGLARLVAPGTSRAALRSLLRSPGASIASVVTLGIGIAAPVSIFDLADGVTASLPGDDADRVVRVSQIDRQGRVRMGFPSAAVDAWADEAVGGDRALVELAAFRSDGRVAVTGGDVGARHERGVYARSGLFRLVDLDPVAGRLYSDDEASGMPTVVIREDLAEERFGSARDAVGEVLGLDRTDHVVVGVLPRSFGFPVDHRLWMQPRDGGDVVWSVAGRLAPGASARTAAEQLGVASAAVAATTDAPEERVEVDRYTDAHFSSAREPETTRRIGTLSLLLVILTAINVAALMVARGMARSRETAVRLAVGASRFHVIALPVMEGLLLATAGGLFGLALGRAGLKVMVSYLEGQAVVVPYWLDFPLGPRSLAMAGLLAILALTVAALLPAIQASRSRLDPTLRGTGGGRSRGGARLMGWIVGVEVALSCFLLTLSSVVVEEALSRIRTGTAFVTEGVVTGRFVLESPGYPGSDARRDFLVRLEEAFRADAAVDDVAFASALPGKEGAVVPAGLADRQVDGELPPAQVRSVDPSFLRMLGGEALTGRLLSYADDRHAPGVAVVNRAFARRAGIMSDAPGRQIVVDRLLPGEPYTATLVGVVDDRGITPGSGGRGAPGIYLPLAQVPTGSVWLLARTTRGTSLFEVWQGSVAPMDPHLPLGDVLTLEETLRRGHGAARLFMSVFITLGSVTLLLALVGLHGVHAFTLADRIKEIGVRRALGAQRWQVLLEGMRTGLRPVWVGLVLGFVPGVLVARTVVPIESDIRVSILVPPMLLLAAVVAIWTPTRKASLVEPTEVLGEL